MYKKISDYGIIGDLNSIALVGLDGAIDWMCMPHIDSPSIFGALLDDEKGGRFSISPTDKWDSVARYIPGTNILQTRFRTGAGITQITDFMPVSSSGNEELEDKNHDLYRCVQALEGDVRISTVFDPRFDYARADTRLESHSLRTVARGNGEILTLAYSREIDGLESGRGSLWRMKEGETVWFMLRYGDRGDLSVDSGKAEEALSATEAYWKGWLRKSETGRTVEPGPYRDMVERSALVLKLLYYEPTGSISAAATTSLPEVIGGERNWDYRYTWVRDTSFTLQALFNLGHMSETEGYIRWIEKLISEHGAGKLQIMYGLRGEEDLPEEELDHLDGYRGSRPVRTGNGAAKQIQLDIYGELMDAALKLSDYVGKIDSELWPFLRGVCEHVVEHWRGRDAGIWEVRGGPFEFVYSKVMCWVALDRGIIIARRYGFPADIKKWEQACSAIKEDVLEKGWNERRGAFVQHYETDSLDSSNLLIPLFGFLPFSDPRVRATLQAVRIELGHDGFLYRYTGEDGLAGKEGTFLLCTFWLINNLVAYGEVEEAEALIQRIEGVSNHLGLFTEEFDIRRGEPLGNFPQAFTHIGYINSVIAIRQAKEKDLKLEGRALPKINLLLAGKIVLNDGEPRHDISQDEIVGRLKNTMNILRGAFFDTRKGRVAYELMKKSPAYGEYLALSYSLNNMDLHELRSPEERTAFWLNMYNVIVIHGVIELGVRDSVKEVRNIFKRIKYRIGGMLFSPEEIEHGILRGNRRPPNTLFRVFNKDDGRLAFSVRRPDPRIHFALVCASSSCPPISVYTADGLEKELTVAGKAFVNGGGVKLDRKNNHVSLSRIFKWYAGDFGKTQTEIVQFLAPYLYNDDDRRFLLDNAANVFVDYQEYDWKLNRQNGS
jgi:GH15 family glucan-1,4-alpha-glucosidase